MAALLFVFQFKHLLWPEYLDINIETIHAKE